MSHFVRTFFASMVALLAAGCATQYGFSDPVAVNGVSEPGISVKAANSTQSVFQRLRFDVQVHNNTGVEQPFSSSNVRATLNGKPARVLSYESQYEELRNIILYYQSYMPSPSVWYQSTDRFGQNYVTVAFRPVNFEIANDALDLQNALDDLAHLEKSGVRPVTVQPGERYTGEITLLNKLGAQAQQVIELEVEFAGRTQQFRIEATELQ